ncbi:MAG TPA: LemA family protein [Chitinophagaceae bacterium]|nr:LemA family protein [Chitinophagaceae bacterium]
MIPLLIAGGVLLLICIMLINIFNRFARNRNTVQDAFSNIDIQLKRRHNLIPNIVNTVKGYAIHESGTLERVIQARNAAVNVTADDINTKIAAENQLQRSLRSIFALTETYPDLKANTGFPELQDKLS